MKFNWKKIVVSGTIAGMVIVTGCAGNVPSNNEGNRNGERLTSAVTRSADGYDRTDYRNRTTRAPRTAAGTTRGRSADRVGRTERPASRGIGYAGQRRVAPYGSANLREGADGMRSGTNRGAVNRDGLGMANRSTTRNTLYDGQRAPIRNTLYNEGTDRGQASNLTGENNRWRSESMAYGYAQQEMGREMGRAGGNIQRSTTHRAGSQVTRSSGTTSGVRSQGVPSAAAAQPGTAARPNAAVQPGAAAARSNVAATPAVTAQPNATAQPAATTQPSATAQPAATAQPQRTNAAQLQNTAMAQPQNSTRSTTQRTGTQSQNRSTTVRATPIQTTRQNTAATAPEYKDTVEVDRQGLNAMVNHINLTNRMQRNFRRQAHRQNTAAGQQQRPQSRVTRSAGRNTQNSLRSNRDGMQHSAHSSSRNHAARGTNVSSRTTRSMNMNEDTNGRTPQDTNRNSRTAQSSYRNDRTAQGTDRNSRISQRNRVESRSGNSVRRSENRVRRDNRNTSRSTSRTNRMANRTTVNSGINK